MRLHAFISDELGKIVFVAHDCLLIDLHIHLGAWHRINNDTVKENTLQNYLNEQRILLKHNEI